MYHKKIINLTSDEQPRQNLYRLFHNIICLFKKLLFTMENATAADSSQSNVSRLYI